MGVGIAKLSRLLLLVFVAGVVSASITQAATAPKPYIVVFHGTVADPGTVARQLGNRLGFQSRFIYRHALKGFAAPLSSAALAALQSDPRVASVEPDMPMHANCIVFQGDECVPNWALRLDATDSSTNSGDGAGTVNINVAVIDSGIDTTHPELNVVGGADCTSGKGFNDLHWHGTMVAGIIGARDNDFGVVGVVPGANLYAVRVLNKMGTGSISQLLCGIDWVTATRTDSNPANDIAVANMSITGTGPDDGGCGVTKKALHRAICESIAAGVTYVAAAGNASEDFQTTTPATYDEVLTATAIADSDGQSGGLGGSTQCVDSGFADDVFAPFSNFATLSADQAHTIAAPGVCDLTTYKDGLYATGNGTSFASPIVAGTIALCIASGPCAGLTPAQIMHKMVSEAATYNQGNPGYGFTGDPQHPVTGEYFGYLIHAGSY